MRHTYITNPVYWRSYIFTIVEYYTKSIYLIPLVSFIS
nr:MAG TPA: hypothetical protein [Caudoviricetes sp.]